MLIPESFLKDKGCIEDGNASSRTAELIIDILRGSEIKG